MDQGTRRGVALLESFSVAEIAQLLHVAEKSVRREIDRGNLRSIRVGRSVRVTRQALMDYVGEGSADA